MPSNAYQNWVNRLPDIQQLLDAHGALVRFMKAEGEIEKMGPGIKDLGNVLDALVSDPSRERPPEVQALNSAAIALLPAHLQGFIVELYEETCEHLLAGSVPDHSSITQAAPSRGKPNVDNINRLFATIGVPSILAGISWSGMNNESLRRKLRDFNELRNRIVHGKSEPVRKSQVENYLSVWTNLAKQIDRKIQGILEQNTGTEPWTRL